MRIWTSFGQCCQMVSSEPVPEATMAEVETGLHRIYLQTREQRLSNLAHRSHVEVFQNKATAGCTTEKKAVTMSVECIDLPPSDSKVFLYHRPLSVGYGLVPIAKGLREKNGSNLTS